MRDYAENNLEDKVATQRMKTCIEYMYQSGTDDSRQTATTSRAQNGINNSRPTAITSTAPKSTSKWVINISSNPLTEVQEKLLAHGQTSQYPQEVYPLGITLQQLNKHAKA